jgi:2-polyprenyl-3-methyl-5-hydroxy-6-metoxy-1,4-benzoquinol methylase
MDLKELDLVDPKTHWYYQSKLVAIKKALRKYAPNPTRIIDIGAGSGFFSISVANFSAGTNVVCVDPNYPADSVERGGSLTYTLSGEPQRGDVYLLIDVLEHVADDVALLRSSTSAADPGAIVIISVPAFMSLWSAHDVFLEHFRRYRLPEIIRLSEEVGLEVQSSQYLFGSIFIPAALVRRINRDKGVGSDLHTLPKTVNSILRSVVSTEHRLFSNRLFGLSAFVVARVPPH